MLSDINETIKRILYSQVLSLFDYKRKKPLP